MTRHGDKPKAVDGGSVKNQSVKASKKKARRRSRKTQASRGTLLHSAQARHGAANKALASGEKHQRVTALVVKYRREMIKTGISQHRQNQRIGGVAREGGDNQ